MELLLNIRSPKGGGGGGGGGHSSGGGSHSSSGGSHSSSSSSGSHSSSGTAPAPKTGTNGSGAGSTASKGSSGSGSSSGGSTTKPGTTVVVVGGSHGTSHSITGSGPVAGLPLWAEILILVLIIIIALFLISIVILAIREHRRKKQGHKPRIGHVIWTAFKIATFIFIVIWLVKLCCCRNKRKQASYAKIEEGRGVQPAAMAAIPPSDAASVYGVPPAPTPYSQGGTYAAATDGKYEPMTYNNGAEYVGTGYTPSLYSNAPATTSMAPSPIQTPAQTPAQAFPAYAPPPAEQQPGAAAAYYAPTPPPPAQVVYQPPPAAQAAYPSPGAPATYPGQATYSPYAPPPS